MRLQGSKYSFNGTGAVGILTLDHRGLPHKKRTSLPEATRGTRTGNAFNDIILDLKYTFGALYSPVRDHNPSHYYVKITLVIAPWVPNPTPSAPRFTAQTTGM